MSRMGMTGRDGVPVDGLGLADAIAALRDDLLKAQAAGAGSEIQLPVESMTVELKVTATRSVGRARPAVRWGSESAQRASPYRLAAGPASAPESVAAGQGPAGADRLCR